MKYEAIKQKYSVFVLMQIKREVDEHTMKSVIFKSLFKMSLNWVIGEAMFLFFFLFFFSYVQNREFIYFVPDLILLHLSTEAYTKT